MGCVVQVGACVCACVWVGGCVLLAALVCKQCMTRKETALNLSTLHLATFPLPWSQAREP